MKKHLLLAAAGFCGLMTSSHASLVAWYKFDEAAGATIADNAVAGGTTGAIMGGVTTGVAGISGNAYQFTKAGAGFVEMGNADFFTSVNATKQLTISTWIKTDSLQATGVRNVAVFAGDDTKAQTYADIGYFGSGALAGQVYTRNRPTNSTSGFPDLASGNTAGDDVWHNVVMTLDVTGAESGTLAFYFDGVLVNSASLLGAMNALPLFNNFEVGRLGRSAPTDYFGGYLDDVQVYSSALTADQVSWLYQNPGLAVVPEPGTVVLAGLGLGVVCLASRRRKRRPVND